MRFRSLLGASVAVLVTLITPSVARAHGHLLRSRPGAGDTLHAAPRLLRLEFNEAPELAMCSLRLFDPRRREIPLSSLRTPGDSARVIVADIAGPLGPGRYTVQWAMTGKDGHPTKGQYTFVVAADADGLATPPIAPGSPGAARSTARSAVVPAAAPAAQSPPADASFDAAAPVYVVVRWMQFAGLLVVIGAMAFHYLVLPAAREPPDAPLSMVADERARRLAEGGGMLLAFSAVARLFAQWGVMRAAVAVPAPGLLRHIMWDTTWGRAWRVEIIALLLLGLGLLVARVRLRARAGWAIATVATLALGVVPALSGHAAASGSIAAIAADALHVLVAGGWLGGLLLLLLAGLPAARAVPAPRRTAAMAALVNAFSNTALVFAMTLVLTGLLATWRNVESVSALLSSTYGRVLLLKLAALGVAALAGLYNWRRARPALAVTGDDRRIRSAMRVELAAGVAILVLTAILVAMPTPADQGSPAPARATRLSTGQRAD